MTITPEELRARTDDFDWISEEDNQMLADAIEIADESSDCLLRSMLRQAVDGWFDLNFPLTESDRAAIDQAIRYLTARGLLERHPEHEKWVRVREAAEIPA